jgi:hypothetical protein
MIDLPKDLFDAKQETTEPAREVLEHLYQAMVAIPSFTLRDGTKVEIEPYYAPQMNDAGELKCGIDARLPDGSHLEFTVANTGWGKSFVADHAQQPKDGPRRR